MFESNSKGIELKSFNILFTVQKWVLSGKKLKVLTKQIIRIEDLVVQRPYSQSNWSLLP